LLILKTLILSLTNWPIISYQAKRKAFSSFRTLKVSSVFGLLLVYYQKAKISVIANSSIKYKYKQQWCIAA